MPTHHRDHWGDAFSAISPSRGFWRHARAPNNLGTCAEASASATGVGSCGDKMTVGLKVENDVLVQVKCVPEGCVYTVACASAMSVLAAGCDLDQALQLQPEDVARELEGLPDDHMHCARLAVNTLGEAIADYYRRQTAAARPDASSTPTGNKGGQ